MLLHFHSVASPAITRSSLAGCIAKGATNRGKTTFIPLLVAVTKSSNWPPPLTRKIPMRGYDINQLLSPFCCEIALSQPSPRPALAQPLAPSQRELPLRSEEHTSELQSQSNLVCRLLLEKKKEKHNT